MTQADLARKLRVDKAAVSRWMKKGKGGSRPRAPIEKVARALGLSVVEFYGADLLQVRAELQRRNEAA